MVTRQRPPARAGFPSLLGFRGLLTVTSYNVRRCCTRLEDQPAMSQFSIVALPSPSLFQPCCCIPCNTPAPPVVPFALIPTGGRFLLPQGIIRPAPAGRHPSPSRPAGRTRPSGPGPLYTVRRDHGGPGALDVTGGRSPDGHVLSSPGREGTCRSGRTRWRRLCGRRRLVRGCPPPSRVRTCGGRATRAGARRGRDRPTRVPDGG